MRNTKIIELKEGSYLELNHLSDVPRDLYLEADNAKGRYLILTLDKKQAINTANALLELAKDMED